MNAPLLTKHFQKHGDEYLLSPAATIVLVAEAITSPDSGPEGKVRSRSVLDAVLRAARAARFEQTDILETMFASDAHVARRLQLCDALVHRVGVQVIMDIVQQGFRSASEGGAA